MGAERWFSGVKRVGGCLWREVGVEGKKVGLMLMAGIWVGKEEYG